MGNSQTWKVHLVFVGEPDPWLTRAAYGSNRIPQGIKTQASASAFFMMLNSEKRHLTEVLDAPPSDIWALHQPRIWPRTTFPPSAIGKRKQHPTGVGYSPSASKDFSTLQPASQKKKEDNVFGYFTAFKASLGFPILGSMVYGYCICSVICLFFKAFFFHPPETGCVTISLRCSQHFHGNTYTQSVLHGGAVGPSGCRPFLTPRSHSLSQVSPNRLFSSPVSPSLSSPVCWSTSATCAEFWLTRSTYLT